MTDSLNPFTPEEQMEVLFLLSLLESQFGGSPSLGAGTDGLYVVVPMCKCSICEDFRKTYRLMPKPTILAAAKVYGDNKLCQLSTREHKDNGAVIH